MVPFKGIQEAHLRIAYSCVHLLINPRYGERVLWVGSVQVCKIYTYMPLPSLPLYHHCISQSFSVEHLLNSPSSLKFHLLVFDSVRMIFR